jgi:hypothetical protein
VYLHPAAASHMGLARFILGPGGLQEVHEPPAQQQPLVCSCGLAALQAAWVVRGLHLFCWDRRRRPAKQRDRNVTNFCMIQGFHVRSKASKDSNRWPVTGRYRVGVGGQEKPSGSGVSQIVSSKG